MSNITNCHIKVSGAWVPYTGLYIKSSGQWVLTSSPTNAPDNILVREDGGYLLREDGSYFGRET